MVEKSHAQRGQSGFVILEASGNKTVAEISLLTQGRLKQADQNKQQQKFKSERQRKQSEFMFFGLIISWRDCAGGAGRGRGGRWQFPSFLREDFPRV